MRKVGEWEIQCWNVRLKAGLFIIQSNAGQKVGRKDDLYLMRMINYLDTAASISTGDASDSSAMEGPSECHDRKFFSFTNIFI